MVGVDGNRALEIGERLLGIVLHQMHDAALMPGLGVLRVELGHGVEHLHGKVEIGGEHESIDAGHEQVDGIAARAAPRLLDRLGDRLGVLGAASAAQLRVELLQHLGAHRGIAERNVAENIGPVLLVGRGRGRRAGQVLAAWRLAPFFRIAAVGEPVAPGRIANARLELFVRGPRRKCGGG